MMHRRRVMGNRHQQRRPDQQGAAGPKKPHTDDEKPLCGQGKKHHYGDGKKKWPTVVNVAKPTSVAGQLHTQVQENKWKSKAKELGKQAHEKSAHIGMICMICARTPDVRQALDSVDIDALQPDEWAVLAKLQSPPRHK